MNDRQKKQSLKIEKTQAVERRNATRRIKQFFMLALVSLPLILYLSGVFNKVGLSDFWSIFIFCAILIVLWFIMLFFDKLVLKRSKKIRQIKNAQAIVDKYNAEILKKREENYVAVPEKIAKEATNTEVVELENATNEVDKVEQFDEINLQNTTKDVIISNEEKKNKLKQKKYGSFNNKRKK